VLVAVRNAQDTGSAPAGIVVAINIQQSWDVRTGLPGEAELPQNVAAALGAELLEGPLDRALFLTDRGAGARVAAMKPGIGG
jgi:hypothetical protein